MLHGLKGSWLSGLGGKMADDAWNMADEMTSQLPECVSAAGPAGAGLFLISRFRHLARRFWNQT